MKERTPKTEAETTLPPNLTIAWATSDISYCDATFRTWREDAQKYGGVRLLDIARDEGILPEAEYKRIFDLTLKAARNNLKNIYHYVRVDNRKFVPEDSNNEPFSERNGWSKDMVIFGYHYHSSL